MIRRYKETEIPTLMDIWEQASTMAHPFLSEAFTQMVKKAMTETYLPNSDTWVYETDNEIIGFISMLNNEIGGLFVHPNHHGKDIGSSLVKHIEQFHQEIEVEVFEQNIIGKPFYEKYGFETIKNYVQDGTGQRVLRMRK